MGSAVKSAPSRGRDRGKESWSVRRGGIEREDTTMIKSYVPQGVLTTFQDKWFSESAERRTLG
jgi:hypothetical protein